MFARFTQWYEKLGGPAKWFWGIFSALIIGGLGNGVWEIFIKPLGLWVFKSISYLLLSFNSNLLDSLYKNAPNSSYSDLIPSILIFMPVVLISLSRVLDKLHEISSQEVKNRIRENNFRAQEARKSLMSLESKSEFNNEPLNEEEFQEKKAEILSTLDEINSSNESYVKVIDKRIENNYKTSLYMALVLLSSMLISIPSNLFSVSKNKEFNREYNLSLSSVDTTKSNEFLSRFYAVSGKEDFDNLMSDMKLINRKSR